jgi:hypothetical protein
MSFSLFEFDPKLEVILNDNVDAFEKMERLSDAVGPAVFPDYLLKYIRRTSLSGSSTIGIHPVADISGYADGPDIDKAAITRKRGFFGKSQRVRFPNAIHHIMILKNSAGRARLLYKFQGSVQFIKNNAHDS